MKKTAGALGKRISLAMHGITLEKVSEIGFANAKANASRIAKGKDIFALHETDLMEGDTALVIAAGPSLHRNDTAKVIRESKFDGAIIATESAMAWCLRHDIVPDLVVTIDPHPNRIVRWFGDPDLTNDSLLHDDYFARQDMDPEFRKRQLMFNKELINLIDAHGPLMKIAIASSASNKVVNRVIHSKMDAYWWNPMYDDYELDKSLTRRLHEENGLPCINAGGNVGSACWVLAHAILQKKRVGLIGMDFSYYGDTPYSQTQYYKEIVNLVGEDRLDEVYVRIMNPHLGKEFYTDPAYLWYRNSFLEMTENAECETYNCSGGGILFGPEINWLGLDAFLKANKS